MGEAVLLVLLNFGLLAAQTPDSLSTSQDRSKAESQRTTARRVLDISSLIWQLQLEDYLIPESYDAAGFANTFRLRGTVPFARSHHLVFAHLLRVTVELKTEPGGPTGLSDTEILDLLIPRRYKWGVWGFGPLLSIPTATTDETGSGKLSIGPTAVVSLNRQNGRHWQFDLLVRYEVSVAGDSALSEVSELKMDPSLKYHLRDGWYLETPPTWVFDFEKETVTIPVNLRFGRVFRIGRLRYNAYLEPQVTLVDTSDSGPKWGIRLGWRFIFRESGCPGSISSS